MARILAEKFGTLERLKSATYEELLSINEVGPVVAKNVVSFFQEPSNLATIDRILQAGVEIALSEGEKEKPLEGKTFVFTGALSTMTRDEAKNLVESLGGKASSSVSKKTDYVVIGENPGSKAARARQLNLKVLTEEEFINLINENKNKT